MIHISNIDLLDIGIRVLKTFLQGFLSAIVVTFPKSDLPNKAILKSITIGGLAAGFCAAMNLVIDLLK